MTQYLWQFGVIGIIIVALLATNSAQQHAQIVVPALTGDSVVLRTTHGRIVLIDTGNDAPKLLEFIGTYRRQIHTTPVDSIIITQSGVAWQGSLTALVMRGVRHIIWLPASHADGSVFCASYSTITCTYATSTDMWHVDGITIHVAGQHSLWVVWSTGQILIAHSGLEPIQTPTHHSITGVIYPWRIEPPLSFHQQAQVAFVLYSDGMRPTHSARRSMAQRRVGHEQLLHEHIDGDIYISLTNHTYIERIPTP